MLVNRKHVGSFGGRYRRQNGSLRTITFSVASEY